MDIKEEEISAWMEVKKRLEFHIKLLKTPLDSYSSEKSLKTLMDSVRKYKNLHNKFFNEEIRKPN